MKKSDTKHDPLQDTVRKVPLPSTVTVLALANGMCV